MKKTLLLFLMTVGLHGQSFVTYDGACGRFGDQLLAYIHAKWVSYTCNIPLLYKPFVHSESLILHTNEMPYSHKLDFDHEVLLAKKFQGKPLPCEESILYIVPYFPESKYELNHSKDAHGQPWQDFEIDWQDVGFIEDLRHAIAPAIPLPALNLPKDRITVGVHVRRGGYKDDDTAIRAFPLKFLPDEFFIEQIIQLYNLLGRRSLYVYICTDDLSPRKIRDHYKKRCSNLDIQFACRETTNSDRINVIEDFFILQQFDCLIHSESNYSFIASKLGHYMVTICPHEFRRKKSGIVYEAHTTINHSYFRRKK